ncbi:hypothetical protein HPT27_02380 [Permianibacter sp. IMCC34836]|uniref:hypothetical protein n=1 Tax=Permianibacter fluminis TaxID=2738515 RepID=UPI00155749C8|nr:hypothetical protein [Permianibacter fluminis]NQD35851.1 hypothetical protein [Permianibacter fluminis]
MKIRQVLASFLGLLASWTAMAADSVVPVYQDEDFVANAEISSCSGCGKRMAVMARHQFVFDGDYNHLYAELADIGIKVTVYDGVWADSDSGEVNFKVASSTRPLERWRRTNLGQRRLNKVSESANAIYAVTAPGQLVTLEFLQDANDLVGNDFTVNVRRYKSDSLVGTRSMAVSPVGGGGGAETIEP